MLFDASTYHMLGQHPSNYLYYLPRHGKHLHSSQSCYTAAPHQEASHKGHTHRSHDKAQGQHNRDMMKMHLVIR